MQSATEQDQRSSRPGRGLPDRFEAWRGKSRRELRLIEIRADAWLLTDALASLSTLGLPQPPAERGRFAIVSRRNRAVLELFASEEEARRALAAVTPRRSVLEGRFAVVDASLADGSDEAAEERGELASPVA